MHTERLEFLSKCFLVVCCVMCLNRFKVVFFITQTHTRDKKKKNLACVQVYTQTYYTFKQGFKKKTNHPLDLLGSWNISNHINSVLNWINLYCVPFYLATIHFFLTNDRCHSMWGKHVTSKSDDKQI